MSDVSYENADNFIRNLVTVPIGCGYSDRSSLLSPGLFVMKVSQLGLPMSLEEIMLDLRVDDPDTDGPTVERMAQGAAALLELRSGWAIRAGVYEAYLPNWAGSLVFRRGPYRGDLEVAYLRGRDDWVDVDPDDFYAQGRGREIRLGFMMDFRAPDLWAAPMHSDRVRIRFSAGFDPAEESGQSGGSLAIDDGLRTTWVALTAHFFKNRELYEAGKLETLEAGAAGLLSAYRTFW